MRDIEQEEREVSKATELRERAAAAERSRQESFERSDTDGFVSQWASGLEAQKLRAQAEIEEAGGVGTFETTVLVDAVSGERVGDARQVTTRFGRRWRIDETDEWLPYRPARASTLGRRGYREETVTEIAPAKADYWAPSGARGLSGATQVRIVTRRSDLPKWQAEQWRFVGAGDCRVGVISEREEK